MKRYVRPMMDAQMFVANEFIAACWTIKCNVPGGYGYFEKNGITGYQSNGDKYIVEGFGCGTEHEASGINAAGPSANAMWHIYSSGKDVEVFYFKAKGNGSSNHHFCTLDGVHWKPNPNASN